MTEAPPHTLERRPLAELDAGVRRAALDVGRSLLLQAPAGSGKTTVLTARYLMALTQVQSPEEILAITFTRKAAAEMRHRVLSTLQGTSRAGIEPALVAAVRERDRQLGWELSTQPARLRVETIDALNARLAHALPVSARSAPSLTIASAPASLYRRAARQALQSAWTEPAARDAVQLLFERLDNGWGRTERLLADMLEHRSHWLPRLLQAGDGGLSQRVQQSLDTLLRAELAAVRSCLPAALLQEGEYLLRETQRNLGQSLPTEPLLGNEPAQLPHWRAFAELALTGGGGWRRRLTAQHGIARTDGVIRQRVTAWIAALADTPAAMHGLHTVKLLPEARLAEAEREVLEALGGLLVRAAVHLQLVFADAGRVDYAYVAGAARASLSEQGEPTDLALRTGAALRHILVDEFQDTSYEQFELLAALTVGWEPGDGRSLFLVGDPMQSIYQFREAEVGLFLRARDRGIGPLRVGALQLRRNFRTRAPLLAWINEQFVRLFPAEDDARLAAIRYLRSVAAEDGPPDPSAVTLHRFAPGDAAGEALRVVQIVRAARAARAGATIAILVVSREHATHLTTALREAQLPVRGVDLQPLRELPVVRDLAALTRALLHGGDRTAWLALARAPWAGLTLGQLERLCHRDDGDLSAALARAGELAHVCAALQPALAGSERTLPLWQRVERCWLRLAGPAVYPLPADRGHARRFLDALAQYQDTHELVGEGLQRLTAQLYAAEPFEPGAVEIMTMHAAKGLEWDVVILPGLGRRTAVDTDPLLHWIELPRPDQDSELLLAPIRAGQREHRGSLAAYIKSLRRERARIERVRLAYVAATRARHDLHLLGALASSEGEAPRATTGSLLHVLWPAIGESFAATPLGTCAAAVETAGAPATPGAPVWRRLPVGWRPPPAPPALPVRRLQLGSQAESGEPEYSWVGAIARAVGTVVHAELHRLAQGEALPQAGLLTPAPWHYERWLEELGVRPHERPEAAGRVVQALQRTLADPQGRWLLGGGHREAHSEWRLTGVHDGRIVSVIFDRMLVDRHGERWIVDYKTSSHEGGAIEQFLDREVERYRPQMQRYAALARELGPEPVRLALYFPLMGVLRTL